MIHDPEKAKNTVGKVLANAESAGVKVIGAYVDPPAHAFYYIVETDAVENIQAFLDPIIDLGYADIRPVSDAYSTVKKVAEGQ
jgi:hypothetical protein